MPGRNPVSCCMKQLGRYSPTCARCYLTHFFGVKNVCLANLASRREVYFLGENGDGKTLLLQGMYLALRWGFVRDFTRKEITGKLLDLMDGDPAPTLQAQDATGQEIGSDHAAYMQHVYAYGVDRLRSTEDFDQAEQYGCMSLFDADQLMRSPIRWLQTLYTQELAAKSGEEEPPHISLDTVRRMLRELLDDEENELEIEVSSKGVRFIERGSEAVRFEQLSAGYRSVMTWVVDLLSRMVEEQATQGCNIQGTEDLIGVVLVDEVGLHLHPKWEYHIVGKLRKWFPQVQFFFTTHSPMLILGASADAVIYKVYREEGAIRLSEPISEFQHLMPNGLVTSPLFGLESMRPKAFADKGGTQDDIVADDYITQQVREVIQKRLQASPGTVGEADILAWVEEELAKYDAEE
jgi:hypothetical protein